MRKVSSEKGDSEDLAEINVIPLMDLALVMIVVLMIISPMAMQSMINIHQAKTVQSSAASSKKPLYLEITEQGIRLNSQRIASDKDLYFTLIGEANSPESTGSIIVTARPQVLHGRLVQVLDLIKQSGIKKISFLKHK
ncbi:MAG: biopolymer transporter ExbD [Elusimicrobiota bacterium]